MEQYAAMIAAQEDREINVIASSFPYDACLRVEISPYACAEVCVSGDAYAEDLQAEWKWMFLYLRHALALCQHPGKMVLVFDDIGTDVSIDAVQAAFGSLDNEQRTINLEAIALTFEREERAAARAAARLERLAEFARAQRRHEDEEITLYEALERQEKGSEEIRGIVEGEEPDAAPEE